MATDYDAPRKTEEEQSEDSIEELKARRHEKNSGKVDEESAAEAASRGVQGFIGKPFDPRSLIESTKQQLPVS